MRLAALVDLHPDLSPRILDRKFSQRSLHEHNECDHRHDHHDHADDDRRRKRSGAALAEELRKRCRNLRDDAGENDQGNAVSDAARRDLFAEPHQEERSADERDHAGNPEEPAGVDSQFARLQAYGESVRLECREEHGSVPSVLVDFLPALLAFFFELLELRHHCDQQLNDNRRRDVRHDSEREHAHPSNSPAGEHVQHAADAGGRRVHEFSQRDRIDAGHRNVSSDPVDNEEAQGKQNALPELCRLSQSAPTEIRRHLFSG